MHGDTDALRGVLGAVRRNYKEQKRERSNDSKQNSPFRKQAYETFRSKSIGLVSTLRQYVAVNINPHTLADECGAAEVEIKLSSDLKHVG